MRQHTYLGLLFVVLFPQTCSCIGQATGSRLPAATKPRLAEDPRLERTVTVDDIGIPLEELLQKVGSKELELACSRQCAQQKLQVRLKARPLRRLMEGLAELVPGEWKTLENKSGYRFEMDEEAIRLRERWWKLFLSERDRAIAGMEQRVLQAMRSEPFRRKPGDPNPEGSDLRIEEQRASEHEFFRALPADLQGRIAADLYTTLFYMRMAGTTGNEEGGLSVPLRELPSDCQERVKKSLTGTYNDSATLDFANATLRFLNAGFSVRSSVGFPDGRHSGAFMMHTASLTDLLMPMLDQSGMPRAVEWLGKQASEGWKRLAECQKSRVWPNDTSAKTRPVFKEASRSACLDWLGRVGNIEYIADYYSNGGRPLWDQERDRRIDRPVVDELNTQAAQHDMSWKRNTDGVYLSRNNRWYRDDRLEVPAPLLRRWLNERERWDRGPSPTVIKSMQPAELARELRSQMDWEAEVATTLTPWQIGSGLWLFTPYDCSVEQAKHMEVDPSRVVTVPPGMRVLDDSVVFPFKLGAGRIMQQLKTDLFYAGLNTRSRSALVEGRLPFAALSPEQRRQALYLCPDVAARSQAGGEGSVLLGLKPRYPLNYSYKAGSVWVRLSLAQP